MSTTSNQLTKKTERKVKRFSKADDNIIIENVKLHGLMKGIRMAAEVLGRNFRAVEDRYHNFICRREFTQEEIQFIVQQHDMGVPFKEIRRSFPGSTPVMIRIEYKRATRSNKNTSITNISEQEEPVSKDSPVIFDRTKTEDENIFEDFKDFKDFKEEIPNQETSDQYFEICDQCIFDDYDCMSFYTF